MEDLKQLIKEGIKGGNKGLRTGFSRLDTFTNNLQMESYHAIGAAAKTGKTAYIDQRYILMPHLLNPNADIKWIYFSYEISRLQKARKWTSWFILYKYNKFIEPSKILSQGENNKLNPEEEKLIYKVLEENVSPLLGWYDKDGVLIKPGSVDFHEFKTNPTGIRNYVKNYFDEIGNYEKGVAYVEKGGKKTQVSKKTFKLKEQYKKRKTIILVDHIGLVKKERGYSKKENIDKLSEYFVEIRNMYKPLIVVTQQFNRDLNKIDRLRFSGNQLKPTKEDFKDSGNTAEDVNQLYALFKPSNYPHIDEYLKEGDNAWKIKDMNKKDLFVHLLESRDSEGYVDLGCCMYGASGLIKELPKLENMKSHIYEQLKKNQY